jgi:hypothetical protein
MEQRLRLVQGGGRAYEKRGADRLRISVPGQIVWKDARGATRLASVVTRDVSEHGVSVECTGGTPIPALSPGLLPGGPRGTAPAGPARTPAPGERPVGHLQGRTYSDTTGAPSEYGLRLLVEPERQSVAAQRRLAGERHRVEDRMTAATALGCSTPRAAPPEAAGGSA